MLKVDNLTKSYGSRVLFEKASFQINSRERVGLVGRNGHGKTTLLRMIVGEESSDAGSISVPKGYRVGHVQQRLDFKKDTVLKEAMRGLLPTESDAAWKAEKILAGLGFSESDLQRHPSEFSGGFQVRLNLAKVLVSEPDLLLLDEPTNYLDITSIRWIEHFLNDWPNEMIVITHDRSFMDKVITHTLGIHRLKIRKIPGSTEKYYGQLAQEEEVYEKTRLNEERKRKELEQFITRFRAKARLANLVQSRVKTLEKADRKQKLEKLKTLDFSFRSLPFKPRLVGRVEGLGFGYEKDRPLFKDLSFSINRGDRIAVVGPNGKGKTTLLKLLAGALSPWEGTIDYNPQVVSGFYEQTNVQSLIDHRTVEEEIAAAHPDMDRQKSRDICGAMLFEGNEALKKVSVLSGGEKARVMLGKLLAQPVNLLILDEPTNHLDLESCDALVAALDNFPSAVILVTHNEMFLNALADRLVVFQKDGAYVFEGGYPRFLETGGWEDDSASTSSYSPETASSDTGPRLSRKDLRKRRSEIIFERQQALKPLEKTVSETEKEIERLEKVLHLQHQEIQTASEAGDGKKIAALSKELHEKQMAVEALYDKLTETSEDIDNRAAAFDSRLAELEEG